MITTTTMMHQVNHSIELSHFHIFFRVLVCPRGHLTLLSYAGQKPFLLIPFLPFLVFFIVFRVVRVIGVRVLTPIRGLVIALCVLPLPSAALFHSLRLSSRPCRFSLFLSSFFSHLSFFLWFHPSFNFFLISVVPIFYSVFFSSSFSFLSHISSL